MSSNFMTDVETMLRKRLLTLWNYPISRIIQKDRDLTQLSDEQLDFFLTNRIRLICMLSEKQEAGSNFDHIARFISNMAFSLHFINHHFRINGQPEKFAHSYMNILRSLKKGGRFLYAPGLPFMEEHLPSSLFFVEKKEIRMENIYLSAKYQNMDMFYATVVEKKEV